MRRWRAVVGVATFVTLGGQPVLNVAPPLPYEDPGACPFECCTYREWSVEADTAVRSARDDAAPVVFRVRPGHKVTGVTGIVTTTKLGRAVATRPTAVGERRLPVEPGEAIYILHYVGEGYWKFWLRGEVDEDQLPDRRDECAGGPCAVQVVEKPATVWWAMVRDAQGREGWTRELDHFGGIDACG